MKLRSGPSGPLFSGNPGDVLVCQGGDEWAPGPGGGGASAVRAAFGLIGNSAVVAPSGVPVPIPLQDVLIFAGPSWTNGDVLAGSFVVNLGNAPGNPTNWKAFIRPEVSIDSGATWHSVDGPSTFVAGGYETTVPLVGDNSGASIACQYAVAVTGVLPSDSVQVRLAYVATSQISIGGAVAPGILSMHEARAIPAAQIAQGPSTVLSP